MAPRNTRLTQKCSHCGVAGHDPNVCPRDSFTDPDFVTCSSCVRQIVPATSDDPLARSYIRILCCRQHDTIVANPPPAPSGPTPLQTAMLQLAAASNPTTPAIAPPPAAPAVAPTPAPPAPAAPFSAAVPGPSSSAALPPPPLLFQQLSILLL